MAALDFPASPTLNQLFVAGNGVTYKWNGTLWVASGGGASISVSDTPPASPAAGAMWWNSLLGAMFIYYNDGNTSQWVPATPSGTNKLLQEVTFETGAVATGTTLIPFDDTIPQQTEGDQYMSLSITPLSATSKLVIEVTVWGTCAGSAQIVAALFQDSTANALAVVSQFLSSGTNPIIVSFRHTMTSGTTSATTFKVRAGGHVGAAGTFTFNGTGGGRIFGGAAASSIVIREVTT